MATLKHIKGSMAAKLLPSRRVDSHKGQNGRVLIVGGSLEYYGAPVLSGLAALHSGADLVYLYVPECNFDVCRSLYPDFFVRKYSGDFLTVEACDEIISLGREKCDCVLLGPGLGRREETLEAVKRIVNELHIPTVLDADAIAVLKKLDRFPLDQQLAITPHSNEFRNLVDRDVVVNEDDPKSIILLRSISMDLHINVLLKGAKDYVASQEGIVEINHTGNAGMTVGGSGDVLAGVVASFIAQGSDPYDACRAAAYYVGKAGDLLQKQKGFNFAASEIALTMPFVLR